MHVGIVMGSDSDLPAMKKAFEILDGFGVTYDVAIASAHRTQRNWLNLLRQKKKKAQAHSLPALAWQQPFRVW